MHNETLTYFTLKKCEIGRLAPFDCEGQNHAQDEGENKPGYGKEGEHDCPGLESFLFGKSAQFPHHPESTVIHPRQTKRPVTDREK